MKSYFLLFIFLLSFNVYSQKNDTQAALYNIGLGSLFGGIGALINKKPNENTKKVFFKGMYQGALGGAVVYGSKKMVYNFHKNENLHMLWSAKLVNAAGISIIENATSNRDFWEKWHIHIGFNRIELETKGEFRVRYKVLPAALLGTIIPATKGQFSFKYSMQTLTPIFISENKIDAAFSKRMVNGEALVNSIIIKRSEYNRVIAHELLHTYQYDDYTYIDILFSKSKNKTRHKKWSKWIHIDILSYFIHGSLYLLENNNRNCYFDNYFEREANFYSNKYLCP